MQNPSRHVQRSAEFRKQPPAAKQIDSHCQTHIHAVKDIVLEVLQISTYAEFSPLVSEKLSAIHPKVSWRYVVQSLSMIDNDLRWTVTALAAASWPPDVTYKLPFGLEKRTLRHGQCWEYSGLYFAASVACDVDGHAVSVTSDVENFDGLWCR